MLLRRAIQAIRLPVLGCFVTVRTRDQQGQLENEEFVLKTYESTEQLAGYLKKDIWESMLHYPFVYIPFSLITHYSRLPSSMREEAKEAVAFRCLSNAKEEQLRQAYDILLPSKTSLKKINANEFDVGRLMFTEHFTARIDLLKQVLRDGGERRMKYLAVLNHFMLNNSTTELVREISEKQLQWDKTGLALALYAQLLIKNNLPFRFLIPKLTARLNDAALPTADKSNIATSLISLPRFYKSFPKDLCDILLNVIKGEVSKRTNYELLQVVRFVYDYRSQEAASLCKTILDELQLIGSSLHNEKVPFFVPLVLKTLKYAGVLNLQSDSTVLSLIEQTPHSSSLFEGISIRHYHTLLLLWQKKPGDSLIAKLKGHFFDSLKFYNQSDEQVELDEIAKFLQLVGERWQYLSQEEKKTVRDALLNMIDKLPVKKTILYYSLLIFLQDGQNQLEVAAKGRLERLTRHYFDLTCSKNNLDVLQVKSNIDQNITLCHLIIKNKFTFLSRRPDIESINYDQKNMLDLNTLEKLVQYLNMLDESKATAIGQAVAQLQEAFIHHLNKKRMAYRTVLSIIQLCGKTDCRRKHLYLRLEKSIFELLNKFPHFVPKNSDLHLIKNNMTSQNFGSKGFQEMVQQGLERPDQWQSIRKKYVEHEQEYWRKVDEREQTKRVRKL